MERMETPLEGGVQKTHIRIFKHLGRATRIQHSELPVGVASEN
jgi:hypothetical protein